MIQMISISRTYCPRIVSSSCGPTLWAVSARERSSLTARVQWQCGGLQGRWPGQLARLYGSNLENLFRLQFDRVGNDMLLLVRRNIGDHTVLVCNHLHLPRHITQVDEHPVDLGDPHQRVLVDQAWQHPGRVHT
jgi:hypothetical protein